MISTCFQCAILLHCSFVNGILMCNNKENMLTKLKEKLSSFREYFCHGGFNVPTEKEIDDAPLVLPETKSKLAIPEAKIDLASCTISMDWNTPFPVITGGIRGWLRGDFNIPTSKDVDGWKVKPPFKFITKNFLEKIR